MTGNDILKEFTEIKTTDNNTFCIQHIKSWNLASNFSQTNQNSIISTNFGGIIAIIESSNSDNTKSLSLFRGDGFFLRKIPNLEMKSDIIMFTFNEKEEILILTIRGELFIIEKINQKQFKKFKIYPVL